MALPELLTLFFNSSGGEGARTIKIEDGIIISTVSW